MTTQVLSDRQHPTDELDPAPRSAAACNDGTGELTALFFSEDLLDIVALESHRAQALVVGEDLGTVEDGVREAMAEHGVLSYRLLWFEDDEPASWPAEAMAAIQVSVASRTRRLLCSSTPSEMPTVLSIRLAASASPQVSRKRGRMFSSTMMRSKLITMSVGFGTMKGLIKPALINPSITAISPIRQAIPNTNGTPCRRIADCALTDACPRRAACAPHRP